VPWKTEHRVLKGENKNVAHSLNRFRLLCFLALAGALGVACVRAQEPTAPREEYQEPTVWRTWNGVSILPTGFPQVNATTDANSSERDAPAINRNPGKHNPSDFDPSDDEDGKQSKRILWIIPNFRAVNANTQLPPLHFNEKLWLATQDTFDYADFVYVGILAGISMGQKSQPSFGQGATGYGRYYWRTFADGGLENYMAEAIVPAATKEDPRYYTLGKGGFFKRTGYALSRLVVTRTDAGRSTFNLSEVVGAGAAAGISNAYYPRESNPWVKTYQRWVTQVTLDGAFNVLKEFWPNLNQIVFHGKY
jgi:hypothetical protein